MKRYTLLRIASLVPIDGLAVAASFAIAYALHFGSLPVLGWSLYGRTFLVALVAWYLAGASSRIYVGWRGHSIREELRNVAKAWLLFIGIVSVILFFTQDASAVSRLFLFTFACCTFIILIASRFLARSVILKAREAGFNRYNLLLVGANTIASRIYHALEEQKQLGYNLVGVIDEDGIGGPLASHLVGKLDDLEKVAKKYLVDETIIALPLASEELLRTLVERCEDQCLRVSFTPSSHSFLDTLTFDEIVGGVRLLRLRPAPLDVLHNRILKRAFDIVFSVVVLTTLLPLVYSIAGLIIKLTSRGPVFFKQQRIGESGEVFLCYKFRTMITGERSDHDQARPDDPRTTRIGTILRRTSLDELPQFWNVMKGEMSVVGPRPHMLTLAEDGRRVHSRYMARHYVKPGITGWAQINGLRGAITGPKKFSSILDHDMHYVEHWSFILDMQIIFRTIVAILRGDGNAY